MLIGNRYEVQEQIGAGGMGAVFRGVDTQTREVVAVKKLKADAVAADPGILQRFQREAEALRQLNHPNIVKVLATAEQRDGHFIVMEYMSGGSLKDNMDGALPIARVLTIALDLADALTRAHRLNIVHRDLKPANVLIADDGTPRLTDFGVARMGELERVTGTGTAVGTLDYLPPEAINGQEVDGRADIWAFGVMLYEMIAGRHPFEGENVGQILMGIITQPPPDLEALRPDVPVALVDLVYRMLEKDRDARISSVRLVGAELEAIIQGTSTGGLSSTARRQIVVPAHGTAFATPTPVISDKPRHNLPAQTTPFVGREAELTEIAKLLNDSARRLVTILAPGGMGKTRLGLEVGQHLLADSTGTRLLVSANLFPNGVYFVPLAPVSEVNNIVPAVAEAVGFEFYPGGEPKQQLLDYLREKRMLLIMDNFEHLMNGAGIAQDILQTAPGIKILATSRERLNLSGETIFNLGGMDFPDWETPADALEYSAVKLFMQGAERSQPGFELKAEDLPYVARICRMVQGMPLGILLAAGWVEMLPLSEISDEISKSFDFLESEMRDLPERHRSIRAVFEYSWNLLGDEERAIFTRLSVFRGGFTREAAQAIAGAGLRPLTALVNKSLLRRSPDSGRYEIHELLRQYAEARLVEDTTAQQAVRDQHVAFYSDFLAKQEDVLWSPHEKKALEVIEVEIENIRAGWNWAIDSGNLKPIEVSLDALELFYDFRSWAKEGLERFEHLAQVLEQRNTPQEYPLLWRVRARLGMLGIFVGDYDRSRQLAQDSLAFFRQQGMKAEWMHPLNTLNYVAMMQGQYADARQYAQEHAAIAAELNNPQQISKARASLGYTLFLEGKPEAAKQIYREVIAQYQADMPPYGKAVLLNNLGEILHAMREEEEAKQLFSRSLEIAREVGNRRNAAIALNNLGNVIHNLGQFQEAERTFNESLAIYRDIGDRRGQADALQRLGNAYFTLCRYPQAKQHLTESLTLYRQLGDLRGISGSLVLAGLVGEMMGDHEDSLPLHLEALALRQETGNAEAIADSYFHLALVSVGKQDYEQALAYRDKCQAAVTEAGLTNVPVVAYIIGISGIIAAEMGDFDTATTYLRQAVEIFDRLGDIWDGSSMRNAVGLIEIGRGDLKEARRFLWEGLRQAKNLGAIAWSLHAVGGCGHLIGLQGDPQRGVALLTLAHDHYAAWFLGKRHATRFLDYWKAQLPAETYASAAQRGAALDLDTVIAELLQE